MSSVFTPAHPLDAIVDEYVALETAFEGLKDRKEALSQQIAAHFPNEPGDYSEIVGKTEVKVKVGEKWSWEQDVLEAMFASTPLPDYIEQRLSVKRKDFEKLSETEKLALLPALTREPAKPRITIVPAKAGI
jgi:hypothetical protein